MTELYGDGQLGLFGARPTAPDLAPLRALAATLPEGLRFGTSSWTFEGWAGIVYHRRYRNKKAFVRESLAEYAEHPLLRTVGIDRSFYGPLRDEDVLHYRSLLPEGFRCCQKLWSDVATRVFPAGDRRGEVNPNFLDPELAAACLRPVREHFLAHAGPILVCVPAAPGPVNPDGFARRVAQFLQRAPAELTFAFELRDRRLLTSAYLDAIGSHGGAHVYNYWERMPGLAAQRAITGTLPGPLVVRLMIPPGRRYAVEKARLEPFDRIASPQPEMRAECVALAREAIEAGREAWVIANNKAEGCSPLTVRALAEAWAG